jgi:hypothetical protein
VSPIGNKIVKTKLDSILTPNIENKPKEEKIKQIDFNKNIEFKTKIPNLKLDNLKNSALTDSKLNNIDVHSARQLMMDSCNKNFIQIINEKIRQRAIDGYTNVELDLEELLNPPKNTGLEIRNLNLSWNQSFNNKDYFERELNKIFQFYKNLEYELNIESNYLVISWF